MKERTNEKLLHKSCGICSQLSDKESAYQKYGGDNNTTLPSASAKLVVVKDFKPHSERKLQLQRCPECGAFYLYETDYEYLVNGSEDEQDLTRLTDSEAVEYLKKAGEDCL